MSDPIKDGVEQVNGNRPYCPKCNELARLLLECRDALPAISLSSAKLNNVSLSLADRIEDALEPWQLKETESEETDETCPNCGGKGVPFGAHCNMVDH